MEKDEIKDFFGELIPDELIFKEETKSIDDMHLDLGKDFRESFQRMGIKNIFIIEFDEMLGPKLKYFTNRDDILNKMLTNPAFTAEITIFAKYADEVRLKDGRKLVINEMIINNKQNYIFIEIGRGHMSPKPLKFSKYIHEALMRKGEVNKDVLKKAIREALTLVEKSTIGRLL